MLAWSLSRSFGLLLGSKPREVGWVPSAEHLGTRSLRKQELREAHGDRG